MLHFSLWENQRSPEEIRKWKRCIKNKIWIKSREKKGELPGEYWMKGRSKTDGGGKFSWWPQHFKSPCKQTSKLKRQMKDLKENSWKRSWRRLLSKRRRRREVWLSSMSERAKRNTDGRKWCRSEKERLKMKEEHFCLIIKNFERQEDERDKRMQSKENVWGYSKYFSCWRPNWSWTETTGRTGWTWNRTDGPALTPRNNGLERTSLLKGLRCVSMQSPAFTWLIRSLHQNHHKSHTCSFKQFREENVIVEILGRTFKEMSLRTEMLCLDD